MELSKLKNLCKTFGRQMPDGEEWKTIKYIHTPGQGSPAFDVEILLKRNEVEFLTDENYSAFIVQEYPAAEVSIQLENVEPVVMFYDLNHITDVSLLIDDDVMDIYDVINKYKPVGYPVNIWFITDPPTYKKNDHLWYRFPYYKDVKVKYGMSRDLKHGEDYTVTIKDSNGNEVDSITKKGDYTLSIDAIGNYYGSAYCYITVEHDYKEPVV